MAEYNTLPPRLPYTLKSRIARVGQLVGMPGPLAKYKADFERISAELQQFEELRHFMAHGLLTVRTGDDGNHQLIYRMYRETKGHAIEEGRLETNLDQLQSAAEQIGRYSIRAVTLFRDVYSAHNLVPR
jgi:hypothetical protein